MIALSLKIKKIENQQFIFSPIRKKWIVLTPEEEVRQKCIAFLVNSKNFPLALFQEEKEFIINNMRKRFDMLIYNAKNKPYILVECKASKTPLNNKNIQQILSYMQYLQTPYIIFVNSFECRLFISKNTSFTEINPIPMFENL